MSPLPMRAALPCLLALLPLGGCASLPDAAADGLVRGTYGGAHAVLVAADGGARVELDCAHGRTDGPLRLSAGGRFDVAGTFVHEGGPALSGSPDARPARFTGTLDGETLQLRIVLADGGASGPFSLRRDARPLLYKCG